MINIRRELRFLHGSKRFYLKNWHSLFLPLVWHLFWNLQRTLNLTFWPDFLGISPVKRSKDIQHISLILTPLVTSHLPFPPSLCWPVSPSSAALSPWPAGPGVRSPPWWCADHAWPRGPGPGDHCGWGWDCLATGGELPQSSLRISWEFG